MITRITQLCQNLPDSLSEEENLELCKLQTELDDLYKQKAKGAFVRSRTRWLEKGEQNSHYFFNLERHHSKINSINSLNVDGVMVDNYRAIATYCSDFFTKVLHLQIVSENS